MLLTILELLFFAVTDRLFRIACRDSKRQSNEAARIKKRATEFMAERNQMSSKEFAAMFFPPPERSFASRIHEFLGEILIVDVTRIHPDDNLFVDLGVEQLHGLDLSYLQWRVKREWGVRMGPAWKVVRTVRDLVTYVCEHHEDRGNGDRGNADASN